MRDARTTTRGTDVSPSVGLVIVATLIVATLILSALAGQAASSAPNLPGETPSQAVQRAVPEPPLQSALAPPEQAPGRPGDTTVVQSGSIDRQDGVLPDLVTALDDRYPGVANLDPGLLDALRRATSEAADDGVTIDVNSGWRSPDYQEQLLREAATRYGSEQEAALWVATAETSAHVSGDAVDIGPSGAIAWLSEHGAEYGLCQIYRNEPWHYELRPRAIDRGCPRMYADPTHDPRMRH